MDIKIINIIKVFIFIESIIMEFESEYIFETDAVWKIESWFKIIAWGLDIES